MCFFPGTLSNNPPKNMKPKNSELRGELPAVALDLLLAGRRERLAVTHPCGATGQLRHAAMSSSSSSSRSDGGWQSSDIDEPETTTTTNQSAALNSAVAKANEATEQRNRLKTELRRAKRACGTHKVWKYCMVYVNTKYKYLAICVLCDRSKRYTAAERKFKDMSPTNLMHHLNTNLPGPGRVQRCQAADNPDAEWWRRWVGGGGG